jgi:seryl-tRNA synthetase
MLAVVLWATGCTDDTQLGLSTRRKQIEQDQEQKADYLPAASIEVADADEGQTAVESALIWSEKYSDAVEKLVRLQQENRELGDATRQQIEQNAQMQQELAQCQKELSEANDMLIEMSAELEKWKTDVLGFREEMRKAQKAQLLALHRVLKLLGSEVPAHSDVAMITANENEGTSSELE